jgi:T5SS/PEP-CTERM-associated repeat protein
MTKMARFSPGAALLATAGLALVFAPGAGATAVADPCSVFQYNSCYIGVDGTDTQTLNAPAPQAYDFVGLGILSTDPIITPPVPPNTGPVSGTLNVDTGGSITLNYLPGTIGSPTFRPLDNSVVVGVSLGSSGALNVNGGAVNTPILFVGQADDARPSTGTADISGGGVVTATLDTGVAGPIPSFNAVNIGRGIGSSGAVTVTGAGSLLNAPAGNISLGRGGSATLDVLAGGQVVGSQTATTVFGSTALASGTTNILVDGVGSKITADQVLLGVGLGSFAPGATPVPDFGSTAHGTGTVDVRNGGEVVADVFSGSGGTLQGNGTITGDVTSTGTVAPGNSPGTLKIDGNFTQTGGVLEIQIAGANVFDIIDVTGVANLENVLIEFLFIDGYAPAAADAFAFLLAPPGGLTITNATYLISGLQPGFDYDVVPGANGELSLIAQNNGVSVPEPGTLVLLGAGLAGIGVRRRSARRRG